MLPEQLPPPAQPNKSLEATLWNVAKIHLIQCSSRVASASYRHRVRLSSGVRRHSALPDFKQVVAVCSQRENTCSSRIASTRSGALACSSSPGCLLAFLAAPAYTASMTFVWDEQKNQSNIRKYGFSFADAWEIFEAPMLIVLDDRFDYGEDHWIGIGRLQSRIVVVVYTEPDEATIRIISLRKALSHERQTYEQAFGN